MSKHYWKNTLLLVHWMHSIPIMKVSSYLYYARPLLILHYNRRCMDSPSITTQLPTMLTYLLPVLLTSLVSGQDTYHCPDGWYWQVIKAGVARDNNHHLLQEHHGVGHCFFFSQEQVTKNDAEILCSFHGQILAYFYHSFHLLCFQRDILWRQIAWLSTTGSRVCCWSCTPLMWMPRFPGVISSGWEL